MARDSRWLLVLAVLIGGVLLARTEKTEKKTETTTITFQEGLNGYSGTIDTEIWAVAPNTILDGNINASTDANNDGGESQVLMRFEKIIGTKVHQIPPNATIHSAKLVVSAFDEGNTVHLHRMLVP